MEAWDKLYYPLDFIRRAKDRLIKRLRYSSGWPSLEPWDYSSEYFRKEANAARKTYQELLPILDEENSDSLNSQWIHPRWNACKRRFRKRVMAGLVENFLSEPVMQNTMVRRGWTSVQQYEEDYLKHSPFKSRLVNFCESRVGEPALESNVWHCSSNTLGHLFYLVRILESHSAIVSRPHTVIEFGGGYGNLARIYLKLIPNATYVIIDLPEFLSLQHLFLKMNFPNASVKLHKNAASAIETDGIHLIPVYLLPNIEIGGDLLISNFSISESTEFIQRLVIKKHFFGCRGIYITGQYSESSDRDTWNPHWVLHEAVRTQYAKVSVKDFHIPGNYELIADAPGRGTTA